MSQLVFGDDTKYSKSKIQPVLIGHKITSSMINQIKKLITDTKPPILLEYIIKGGKIEFNRIL